MGAFVDALTEKERKTYDKWYAARLKRKRTPVLCKNYEIVFRPTGIGTVVILRCSCCEETDITDYDSW